MKHIGALLLAALALASATAQQPETVAWRNGAWFDGTGFRRVDVYSVGSRLALKDPCRRLPAITRIAEELNSQYLLGYSSPSGADGRFHSIRVRLPGRDYRVRARNGYVAPARE